ncbi:MAG: DUF2341 domain-containing protein, partial [Candidatus Aenigmatarchaeota archaeon]
MRRDSIKYFRGKGLSKISAIFFIAIIFLIISIRFSQTFGEKDFSIKLSKESYCLGEDLEFYLALEKDVDFAIVFIDCLDYKATLGEGLYSIRLDNISSEYCNIIAEANEKRVEKDFHVSFCNESYEDKEKESIISIKLNKDFYKIGDSLEAYIISKCNGTLEEVNLSIASPTAYYNITPIVGENNTFLIRDFELKEKGEYIINATSSCKSETIRFIVKDLENFTETTTTISSEIIENETKISEEKISIYEENKTDEKKEKESLESRKIVSTRDGNFEIISNKGIVEASEYDEKIKIKIYNLSIGEEVKVSLVLPFEIDNDSYLYLWKEIDGEYIKINYEIEGSNRISFILKDGEIDEDKEANGVILDPILIPKKPEFSVSKIKEKENEEKISILEKGEEKWIELRSSKGKLSTKIVDPKSILSKKEGLIFPYKLMKIDIEDLKQGEEVELFLRFPFKILELSRIVKFDSERNEWSYYPFEKIDEFTIKVRLKDGAYGDEDYEANGIIKDDIGLAYIWWNESFLYRTIFKIDNTQNSNNLSDYQIMIEIDTSSLISSGRMRSDCGDIRFAFYNETSNIETEIPYWLWRGCNTTSTKIWIKVPFIRANNLTYVSMYYGNSSETSKSNSSNVFISKNADFELDSSFWVVGGVGDHTRVNGTDANVGGNVSYSGNWSFLVGFRNATLQVDKDLVYQDVTIPNDANVDIVINLLYRFITQDACSYDFISIYVKDTSNNTLATILDLCKSGTRGSWYDYGWRSIQYNLSNFKGTTRRIWIEVKNLVSAIYRSYAYIDDIFVRKLAYPEPIVTKIDEEYLAMLNVTIYSPIEGQMLTRYESFNMNGSITCNRTDCNLTYAHAQLVSRVNLTSEIIEDTEEEFNSYFYRENISISSFGIYLSSGGTVPSWHFSSLSYRIPINVTNNLGSGIGDYQLNIIVNTSNLISQGKMRSDCGDIRFTQYQPATQSEEEIPYWLEGGCNSENTNIWVRIPYLPTGLNIILMYYGNSSFQSLSNGSATFLGFNLSFDGPIGGRTSLGGYAHTCALLSNGSAKCWGYNYYGQCGVENIFTTQQIVENLSNVVTIAVGGYHTCALLSNGSAKCWGNNWYGQLGD